MGQTEKIQSVICAENAMLKTKLAEAKTLVAKIRQLVPEDRWTKSIKELIELIESVPA